MSSNNNLHQSYNPPHGRSLLQNHRLYMEEYDDLEQVSPILETQYPSQNPSTSEEQPENFQQIYPPPPLFQSTSQNPRISMEQPNNLQQSFPLQEPRPFFQPQNYQPIYVPGESHILQIPRAYMGYPSNLQQIYPQGVQYLQHGNYHQLCAPQEIPIPRAYIQQPSNFQKIYPQESQPLLPIPRTYVVQPSNSVQTYPQESQSLLQNPRPYIEPPNNNFHQSYTPQQQSQSSLHHPGTYLESLNHALGQNENPLESQPSLENLESHREPTTGEYQIRQVEKPITRKPVPPPNGGATAWLQVLGAFFLFFNSWGIINTFGAIQAFYLKDFLSSNTPSQVSWIGTTQGFIMILLGVLSGPLYDMGHLHALIYTGMFLSFLGLIMASFADQFAQVFLSLGVFVGLGSGCLFVPSISIVSTYFSTKRAAATGLTAAGGSLGGVIFPIVFRRAQATIGYGWAIRIIAFILLTTLVIPAKVLKPRTLSSKARKLLDFSAFKDPAYVLFSFALFLIFIGLYIPFFYIPLYAMERLGIAEDLSFYLLAIMNAASIFGRIIPNIIADHLGAMHVLIPCTFVTGMLAIAWIWINSVDGIVIFCILYGFFSGAIVSLPPSALVLLSPDLSVVGTRMGMCFSFAGFGLLIGSPIAGTILRSNLGFKGLEVFSGANTVAGFVFIFLAYLVHRRS